MLVSNFDVYGKKVYAKDLSYFAGKHVCIIGDSISDNATNPPNWTVEFTNEVKKVGATVTNLAKNGSSFAGWGNNQGGVLTAIPSADIYIVFLGINDFQGQFPWTGGLSKYETLACVKEVLGHIVQINSNADFYYISPIKIFREATNKLGKPLIYYRALYENIAIEYGYTVISGFNAPQLSILNQTEKLTGGIHPTSEYGKVFARYILNAMISGISSPSPFSRLNMSGVFKPSAGAGFVTLNVDSAFNTIASFTINSFPLSMGWNTLCALNDVFTTFPILKQQNVYNPNNNKYYQLQITADGIQIYSTANETTAISIIIEWCNRWDTKTINE